MAIETVVQSPRFFYFSNTCLHFARSCFVTEKNSPKNQREKISIQSKKTFLQK